MTASEYTALCNKLDAALDYIDDANELIRRAKKLLYDIQETLDPPAE